MSKNILIKLLLPFLILAMSNYASSQIADPLNPGQVSKPIYIGPVIGYNAVSHAGTQQVIQTQNNSIDCPNFEDGSENGFYVGVAFEYLLGGAKNSTSSIIAKLLYSTYPGFVEKEGDQLPTSFNGNVNQPAGQQVTQTLINFTREIDYSVISGEVLYKMNIAGTPIGAVAGLAFDFTMTATDVQQMKLASPSNAEFIKVPNQIEPDWFYPDAKTLQFGQEGGEDIAGAAGLRVGLKLGLQYEFSFPGFLIVPHMFYNYGLTSLVNEDQNEWRVSAFQIGTDVRFAF
ncbi:hypothetical protein OAQ99_00530 [Candidatus Kapabacteria bacterium]|nr:hypothetical protein [Candidatus Kapabacteria bacterium]